MRPQLDYIQRQLVPLLGFQSLGLPCTEADDLIASYAHEAMTKNVEVVIATNDKDLFQLVNDLVKIYSTNKTDLPSPEATFALLDSASVQAKWGVPPHQIGEVLSLTGDSADNIPGVSGLGPKTAVSLILEHGGLDAVLQNLDAVKNERIREKLRAALEIIAQNREMVKLDLDLPLPAPLDELVIRPNYPELAIALETCEFKSLLQEVRAEAARLEAPSQGELLL
jgi:DNA polymerase-1